MVIELPHGTHSTGPKELVFFFQASKTPFLFCHIDNYYTLVSNKLCIGWGEDWELLPTQFSSTHVHVELKMQSKIETIYFNSNIVKYMTSRTALKSGQWLLCNEMLQRMLFFRRRKYGDDTFFCQAFYLSELKCLRPATSTHRTTSIRHGKDKHLSEFRNHSCCNGILWTHPSAIPGRTDQQEAWIDRRINLLTRLSGIIYLNLHEYFGELFLQIVGLFKLQLGMFK